MISASTPPPAGSAAESRGVEREGAARIFHDVRAEVGGLRGLTPVVEQGIRSGPGALLTPKRGLAAAGGGIDRVKVGSAARGVSVTGEAPDDEDGRIANRRACRGGKAAHEPAVAREVDGRLAAAGIRDVGGENTVGVRELVPVLLVDPTRHRRAVHRRAAPGFRGQMELESVGDRDGIKIFWRQLEVEAHRIVECIRVTSLHRIRLNGVDVDDIRLETCRHGGFLLLCLSKCIIRIMEVL